MKGFAHPVNNCPEINFLKIQSVRANVSFKLKFYYWCLVVL